MYFLVPQHTIKFTFFGNKANFVGGGLPYSEFFIFQVIYFYNFFNKAKVLLWRGKLISIAHTEIM